VRLIFCGTPEFARVALERLHTRGHTIALVLTQPDRPAGRGMKVHASAVKQFALEHAIPVAQPRSLRLDGKYPDDAAAAQKAIVEAGADAMVVAAYGLILPQWVLDHMAPTPATACAGQPPDGGFPSRDGPSPLTPRKYGCLNIHGSVLPRWRGAAPIHRAIEAGDSYTGVTIMQMDAGLDTGDMLLVQSLPISDDDTTASLHDKVANLGAGMVVQALDLAAAGRLHAQPQPGDGITYAHKIEKHEAATDWRQDAATIVRRVRAFNPFPGATLTLNGEVIKVWSAHVAEAAEVAGVVQEFGSIVAVAPAGIAVSAMNSIVILTELQRPGGKRLAVADFLRGFDLQVGQVLV
jgi:methionyl-tRNA formyltransferase